MKLDVSCLLGVNQQRKWYPEMDDAITELVASSAVWWRTLQLLPNREISV